VAERQHGGDRGVAAWTADLCGADGGGVAAWTAGSGGTAASGGTAGLSGTVGSGSTSPASSSPARVRRLKENELSRAVARAGEEDGVFIPRDLYSRFVPPPGTKESLVPAGGTNRD
jgi:hypothetical protein